MKLVSQECLYLSLNKYLPAGNFTSQNFPLVKRIAILFFYPLTHFMAVVPQTLSGSYSGFLQTSKMELFAKSSIFDVRGDSENASAFNDPTGF